jgi:hypothetical protein
VLAVLKPDPRIEVLAQRFAIKIPHRGIEAVQQARQAQVDAVRAYHGTAGRNVTPEKEQAWKAYVDSGSDEAGPKVTAQISLTGAKTDTETEKKANLAAKTETIDALRDPQVAALFAKTNLDNERRTVIALDKQLKEIKLKNGGLTEAAKLNAQNTLATLDTKIAAQTKETTYAIGPEKAARAKAIQQLRESSDAIRAQLGQPPKYGTAPASTKGKYTPGKMYKDSKTGTTAVADESGNLPDVGAPAQ